MQLTRGFITGFVGLGLLITSHFSYADGVLAEASGTVSVKRNNEHQILSRGSSIKEGDTVTTEKSSYAQIRFADGAVMTLKPSTSITINEHHFAEGEPDKDSSVFSLIKGGLRTVSGLIGKRGNRDAYKLNTATATIGIRGTVFDVDDCASTTCTRHEQAADTSTETTHTKPDDGSVLVAAVYVGVRDGEVVVRNDAGELVLSAGQFGISPATSVRPTQLPGNPGLDVILSIGGESSIRGQGFEIRNCK